jgi:4-amino-4-deoxy-L-arabinose transferase-like glycosyltransferase
MFSEVTAQVLKVVCIVLLTLLFVSLGAVWYYSAKADRLQSTIDERNGANQIIVQQVDRDYNKSVEIVTKTQTLYKTRIEYVDRYIGDENASDCTNGIDLFRSSEF